MLERKGDYYLIDDERYERVTTIAGMSADSEGLKRWQMNHAIDAALAVRPADLLGDADATDLILADALSRTYEKARIGSEVHTACERIGRHLYTVEEAYLTSMLEPEHRAYLHAFIRFLDDYEAEVPDTEFVVVGDGYAGTVDALVRLGKPLGKVKRLFLDYKTGSPRAHHACQVAAYRRATHRIHDDELTSNYRVNAAGLLYLEESGKYKLRIPPDPTRDYAAFRAKQKAHAYDRLRVRETLGVIQR